MQAAQSAGGQLENEKCADESVKVIHDDNQWGMSSQPLCEVALCCIGISVVGESVDDEQELEVGSGLHLAYAPPLPREQV